MADDLETLIGPVDRLPVSQYAQAIALALILRHSWRADDFDGMVERLGLRVSLR